MTDCRVYWLFREDGGDAKQGIHYCAFTYNVDSISKDKYCNKGSPKNQKFTPLRTL